MRIEVWCTDDQWRVERDGITVVDGLTRAEAIRRAVAVGQGQLLQLIVHDPPTSELPAG